MSGAAAGYRNDDATEGPATARVSVLLPLPLAGGYDYRVPDGLTVAPGDIVEVPLGRQVVFGVVWGAGAQVVADDRLKPIRSRLDTPPLPGVSRRFVDWVAGYTVNPPGAVLRMVIPVADALVPERPLQLLALAESLPSLKPTRARERVLALLREGPPRSQADLAREAGCGEAVVRGLLAVGALVARSVPRAEPPHPDWQRPGPTLSIPQAAAVASLRGAVGGGFGVHLVDGVPGSGKTEVYFEAIAETLAQGLQVLVLLPEIALGAQWRRRFAERFGAPPQEWHSDLGRLERRRTWRAVAEGRAPLVVGARSALFLPFPRLGLIVVDEEHDASYKQEDGVAYHARDMAIVRARLGDIPCVLVSATPALETVVNAAAGRYQAHELPERHSGAPPPPTEVVDLRRTPPPQGAFIAPPLRAAIAETLAAERQAVLFLNRRGYAPLTLCRACGHRFQCPSCTAWLVEHRLAGRLQCHHCGYTSPVPAACPACAATDTLAACGPGAERLVEELAALLPAARIVLATSDTLTGPAAAADLVERIERHEVDVIVGTQLIAKGYHFPGVALVGVVDADLGLAGGDLRASERTFQLLYQVAGRTGREAPGRVLLQTCLPEHPVIRALVSGDRERFNAAEIEERRAMAMPPFGRLAALILSGRNEAAVDAAAAALARAAPKADGVRILGPAPAPLAMLRGRHRRRLLVRAPRPFALSTYVRDWLAAVPVAGGVRVQIDIDPQSFL